ncbi:Hypothetical protein AA314_07383 [Archangium gephyra]|uniref:Uncharacterized protein n=1 Tax=Archangium gephyra TaxID=48 RepID=A0AAC8TGZ0_9BACT|nr:Hypothetical protein AA314_07383 [Archangium gephyra]
MQRIARVRTRDRSRARARMTHQLFRERMHGFPLGSQSLAP